MSQTTQPMSIGGFYKVFAKADELNGVLRVGESQISQALAQSGIDNQNNANVANKVEGIIGLTMGALTAISAGAGLLGLGLQAFSGSSAIADFLGLGTKLLSEVGAPIGLGISKAGLAGAEGYQNIENTKVKSFEDLNEVSVGAIGTSIKNEESQAQMLAEMQMSTTRSASVTT